MDERDRIVSELLSHVEGTYVPPPRDTFDLNSSTVFAAISGAQLSCGEREIVEGVVIRECFVDIILPSVMAFSLPTNGSGPHPGPWAALSEIIVRNRVELEIASSVRTADYGLDRLNFIWLITTLLRLRLALPIAATFLSDRAVAHLQNSRGKENTMTIELGLAQQFPQSNAQIQAEHVDWIGRNLKSASQLFTFPEFRRALITLDNGWWHLRGGASVVTFWAAIETLLRPGRRFITKRISQALAALLYATREERDRAYSQFGASYEARGGSVHDGQRPQDEEFAFAALLARDVFLKVIETCETPNIDNLVSSWKHTQGTKI